ncbi:MAG: NYN domain-containing protein [Elusimicrobia bacterium]|jgi:predicted RNA-binding protein with PIN domain|nr:NYN domain-containing protein [Elusimicrobiota bacterium]
MALVYIIDGYNLIESHRKYFPGSLYAAREKLINQIKKTRPEGGLRNKVTIVFDGQPGITFPPVKNLDVKFTAGREADCLIEDMVRKSRYPASVIVITDDRRLIRFIKADGAKAEGTVEFIKKLFRLETDSDLSDISLKDIDSDIAQKTTDEFKKKWLKHDKKE